MNNKNSIFILVAFVAHSCPMHLTFTDDQNFKILSAQNWNNIDTFTTLMGSCADINQVATDHRSWFYNYNSCVHFAAAHNQMEFLSLLVKHGADVNLKRYNGKTPLHAAIFFHGNQTYHDGNRQDNTQAIQFLLEAGANPEIKNCQHKTAFDLALKNKKWSLVSLFINHLEKKCSALEQRLQQSKQEEFEALVSSIPKRIARLNATPNASDTFAGSWTDEHKALWPLVRNSLAFSRK